MIENPLAEYDTQIAAIRVQMAPLQARLAEITRERDAYADLLAEGTDDPALLAALRESSRVAYRKFVSHVRATTHPAIWDFADWLPIPDHASTGYLLAPSLRAERIGDDPTEHAALADSIVEFAARFCPVAPEQVDWPVGASVGVDLSGMLYAEVLAHDCGEEHDYMVWFTPDGTRAWLLDAHPARRSASSGTLPQVLGALARDYARP